MCQKQKCEEKKNVEWKRRLNFFFKVEKEKRKKRGWGVGSDVNDEKLRNERREGSKEKINESSVHLCGLNELCLILPSPPNTTLLLPQTRRGGGGGGKKKKRKKREETPLRKRREKSPLVLGTKEST